MNLRTILSLFFLLIVVAVFAQETAQGSSQEPAASQKVILYGMTILGVLLIGLGLRNSKFFKKK